MIQGKWLITQSDINIGHNIADKCFNHILTELPDYLHYELDSMANHLAVVDTATNIICGYGRVTYDLEDFVIDNICVLPEHRHKFFGDFIARVLVDKAIQCGADRIFCSVPKNLVDFAASIGFKVFDTSTHKPQYLYMHTDYICMCLIPKDFTSRCGCKH